MRVRVTFPTLFILLTIFLLGLAAVLNQRSYSRLIQSHEQQEFKQMEAIVRFNLKGGIGRALARAEMLADLPNLRDAIKKRQRDVLFKQTESLFAHQKDKYGVAQLQFAVPPHHMFLRVQNPSKFGDDLSSFRHTVVAAFREKKNISGVEISRSGPALFGVVPMFDGREMIGSIEMGMEFAPILDSLKSAYDFDMTFFVEQKPLEQTATLIDKTLLNPDNAVGTHLNFHSTDWKGMRELIQSDQMDHLKEVRTYTRELDKRVYGLVIIPVQDFNKQIIGYLVACKDFQGAYSNQRNFLILQLILTIFSAVLLAGIVMVVLKGGLIQPLGRLSNSFDQLAETESAEVLESDDFPRDLRPLVKAYNRLVSRGGPKS